MEPPKIYRLGLTGQITWVLMFGAPLLLAVAILLGIMALTGEGDIPTFFVVPWVALLILSLVHALYRGVTSITLEDDLVTFKSPLRSVTVPATEILSVESPLDIAWHDKYNLYYCPSFRHSGGRITLFGPFDDFQDLVMRLKHLNPELTTKRL
ncbi:MAG TPA: hypothetical protein VLD61_05455 [Methylomirabilota bacterium]|nr:hypothetical protein [Methylomirabilota bacterium]